MRQSDLLHHVGHQEKVAQPPETETAERDRVEEGLRRAEAEEKRKKLKSYCIPYAGVFESEDIRV